MIHIAEEELNGDHFKHFEHSSTRIMKMNTQVSHHIYFSTSFFVVVFAARCAQQLLFALAASAAAANRVLKIKSRISKMREEKKSTVYGLERYAAAATSPYLLQQFFVYVGCRALF